MLVDDILLLAFNLNHWIFRQYEKTERDKYLNAKIPNAPVFFLDTYNTPGLDTYNIQQWSSHSAMASLSVAPSYHNLQPWL